MRKLRRRRMKSGLQLAIILRFIWWKFAIRYTLQKNCHATRNENAIKSANQKLELQGNGRRKIDWRFIL